MLLERLLALVTGAIVALCLGLGLVMMALGPGKRPGERNEAGLAEPVAPERAAGGEPALDAARAQIARTIEAASDYRPFFDRLRLAFPADYDAAVDIFAKDRLAGGGPEASADFYLSETVRRLRQARGVLAAKAEPVALARVFDLQLDVLRALSGEDKRLCAIFLYGGVDQDFHRFAARRRALIAEMASVVLEAIVSGKERGVAREAPSEDDFRALEAALAAGGLRKEEIDSLLDGKTPDPPFDDQQTCAIGQTYLETLRALPEPARLRIYGLAVELMARS